jgi:hypothetical protein
MRTNIQTANLFATLGQGQGNATANTRMDQVAAVLAVAPRFSYARSERSIARASVRPCVGEFVAKRSIDAVKVRDQHAHLPRRLGDGLRQWHLGCRMSPAECSVS